MSHEHHTQLIAALNNCATECNHCATACLDEPDVQMLVSCIRMDLDCADICGVTATFLARGSEHGKHLLKECAEVCNACAEECEKHAHHHEHCKRCAEECRSCAEACTSMA